MVYGMLSTLSRSTVNTGQSTLSSGAAAATAAAARNAQRDFPDAPEAGVSILVALLNPAHGEFCYVFSSGSSSGADDGDDELHRRENHEQRSENGKHNAVSVKRKPFADWKQDRTNGGDPKVRRS